MTASRRRILAATVAAVLATPATAYAHGLVGRTDLPIPEWLFGWAATVVLVMSFVALSTLWTSPRLERARWRPLSPPLGRALTSRPVETVLGVAGVGLLALVLYAGFTGAARADENITPTFAYVTFWLGLVPVSVLFGDVFALLNPWRAVGRAVSRIARPLTAAPPLRYPAWLGRWPAAADCWASPGSSSSRRAATVRRRSRWRSLCTPC